MSVMYVLNMYWAVSTSCDNFVDASYSDPLGDIPERPKTAASQKQNDFECAELGDLLPE